MGGWSLRCAACHVELRPAARFCDACGSPQAVAGLRARDPREYTPRHLAERILKRRAALEGERKQVSILFVDVKGSVALAEQVDDETWHRVMDRFFAILADVVHGLEGTINQFTGDGVMALFGAPLAHEDHAQRACLAALRIGTQVRRYAEELKRRHGLDFSLRMGINSGEVVVASIGDDLRMDYTAQGHSVGLAARLERLADPGSAYLSEHTARLVEGFFQLRDLGRFELRGASAPVAVYRLEGIGPLRTRFEASCAHGLSPFVGRREELARLDAALRETLAGSGRVVALEGEAGVGKSRLCFEFAERCRARGIDVRTAQALPHGKMIPFLPVLSMLRTVFGIDDRDGAEAARRKVADSVLPLDPALAERLPLLFEFLGIAEASAAAARLDPEARFAQLVDSVMRIVRARSRIAPALFLIEDLHWLDGGSEGFLERLVGTVADSRSLVIVNFRSDYAAGWLDRACVERLRLAPLDPPDVDALLDGLVGSRPSTRALRDLIRARAAGNPFFVEEIVQGLLDSGDLAAAEGGLEMLRPVERIQVPASVEAILAARIDRLSEPEKLVLQTAAVIGRRFAEPLLSEVVDLPEGRLAEALRNLVAAELVREEALHPRSEWSFRHPLIQEVAYRAQLAEGRARIHGAVEAALLRTHETRLDENAALLAHHAEAAGRALEAARWHRRAAEWVGTRDVSAAHRHWRTVLELLRGLPESDARSELGLTAHIWLQQLAWRLGLSKDETSRNFAAGVELARRAGNGAAVALLALGFAAHRGVVGDEEGQYRHAAQAASQADALGAGPIAIAARAVMASSLHFQGRLRDALEVADRALEEAPPDPEHGASGWIGPSIYVLGLRGLLATLTGDSRGGEQRLARALDLAQRAGDAEVLGCIHGFLASHAGCSGDAARALAHARELVAIAERTGIPLLLVDGYLALGDALGRSGAWDEALEAYEHALEVVEARRVLLGQKRRLKAALATACLERGEPERARHLAEELLASPHVTRTRLVELAAQLALSRALVSSEGPRAAEAAQLAISRAIELVEKSGATAFEPEIHRALAELARSDGDESTRARHAREALRLQRRLAEGDG